MDENKKDNKYTYTYSAKEQREVENIKKKYMAERNPAEPPLERLRKIEKEVTRRALSIAVGLGILFTLILGGGMSLILTVGSRFFILGLFIGLLGLIGVLLMHPLHTWLLRFFRNRRRDEVLRLADELSE